MACWIVLVRKVTTFLESGEIYQDGISSGHRIRILNVPQLWPAVGRQHDSLELPGKRFRSGGSSQENLAIACKVFILGLGAGNRDRREDVLFKNL